MQQEGNILRIRDEILKNLLYYIASNPELNSGLILQGGGALHFIYSSPRYSSDLDFVCSDLDAKADSLVRGLATHDLIRHLHPTIMYAFRVSKQTPNLVRISYTPPPNQPAAKVEIFKQSAEEYTQTTGAFQPLLVETPREIYADKVVATLARMSKNRSLKPTDLFDLEYLADNLEVVVAEDRLERKSRSYGLVGWSQTAVEDVKRYIRDPNNHENFRRALRKTLMPDVYAHRQFGTEFFEKAVRHFERLKNI